jgi:hypothetical protein
MVDLAFESWQNTPVIKGNLQESMFSWWRIGCPAPSGTMWL